MTKHSIVCFEHMARSISPHGDPTPIEIQRWEDDGGAALPDASRQHRHEPHLDDEIEELAVAE